ncbi:hypothetical protein K458DRAFT_431783 [Lentithecium fluviatile CBS 122367]|uniref:cutinase n=1 Tax=Lentithecium fluviatile CBS 122367 TaxID=1168545 RepID=A0A6G1J255_9PLEO|nr:hypothetical protein K458DRAFT_431783 [Lentithecium fluviatile CBS 122367]
MSREKELYLIIPSQPFHVLISYPTNFWHNTISLIMKPTNRLLSGLLLSILSITSATPTRRDAYDTSTAMDDVIAGRISCASTAVIFGRGTFDTGNIGVWTGPQFEAALLRELNGDIHFQGINRADYPADLDGYAREGGSETCAVACAATVNAYAAKCPEARIFVSGWRLVFHLSALPFFHKYSLKQLALLRKISQGALCAHKCVNYLSTPQLSGLVVFGSENSLMTPPSAIPLNLPYAPYCNENSTAPDLLCTSTWTSGFDLPDSLVELTGMVQASLQSLKSIAGNEAQREAAVKMPGLMAVGLARNAAWFTKDLVSGHVRRWLVLLPHFEYGTMGYTDEAAGWVAGVVRR